MTYTPEYVVETIRNRIEEAGNQKILAEEVGINQTTLSKWKNGKQLPTPETFFKYFPLPEERVTSRPKQPAVETMFIANNANDEIIKALCWEIKQRLIATYKRCHIRICTLDWHNVLVISIEKKRKYFSFGSTQSEYFFRQVYPDPIDHAYLDTDWAKVVVSDFTKKADKWLLKQFKG